MNTIMESVLAFLILSNFMLLGSSRLGACIRMLAAQGFLLGLLQLLVHWSALTPHVVGLAVGGMVLKGLVIPWLLMRAVRDAGVRREIEPLVGYTWSLILGTLALGVSLWAGGRMHLPVGLGTPLMVAVAIFTMQVGMLLIVGRRKALTQVMGYLALENGIYAFGVGLAQEEPMLVGLGVLLDLFVGVFVMGIAIFHINREFDSINTDRLASLKDWT